MIRKITKTKKGKAFTLIELLIVISIIGILASTILGSMANVRAKALAVQTKTRLAPLKNAIYFCCENTSNSLNETAGEDICSPDIGTILPTASELNVTYVAYELSAGCSAAGDPPEYVVVLEGHARDKCNSEWTLTSTEVTPPAGC